MCLLGLVLLDMELFYFLRFVFVEKVFLVLVMMVIDRLGLLLNYFQIEFIFYWFVVDMVLRFFGLFIWMSRIFGVGNVSFRKVGVVGGGVDVGQDMIVCLMRLMVLLCVSCESIFEVQEVEFIYLN